MPSEQELLEEDYIGQGFSLVEVEKRPDETIFDICFKGVPIKRRFSTLWATREGVREACRQYIERLNGVAGVGW